MVTMLAASLAALIVVGGVVAPQGDDDEGPFLPSPPGSGAGGGPAPGTADDICEKTARRVAAETRSAREIAALRDVARELRADGHIELADAIEAYAEARAERSPRKVEKAEAEAARIASRMGAVSCVELIAMTAA